MKIDPNTQPRLGWKQDAVLLLGPKKLTGKMGQGDRPDPFSPGWNGKRDCHRILRYSLNSLWSRTWIRITPPSSAFIPDLSSDV